MGIDSDLSVITRVSAVVAPRARIAIVAGSNPGLQVVASSAAAASSAPQAQSSSPAALGQRLGRLREQIFFFDFLKTAVSFGIDRPWTADQPYRTMQTTETL